MKKGKSDVCMYLVPKVLRVKESHCIPRAPVDPGFDAMEPHAHDSNRDKLTDLLSRPPSRIIIRLEETLGNFEVVHFWCRDK